MTRLDSFFGTLSAAGQMSVRRPSRRERLGYRPILEYIEERIVPSALGAAPSLAPALLSSAAPTLQHASSLLPITINNVSAAAGQLVANGSLGSQPISIPLGLTVPAGQMATSTTQILNLHVGALDLNLLGLEVKTSEICLNISAQSGPGNLLGNVLSNVAHLLDQGLPLNQILGSLTSTDLGTLTTGLTDLLDGALGQLTAPTNLTAAGNGMSVTSTGSTSILHLSVGPLNLNLLGLQVNLDNCNNGPVTVDIIAHTGPGNLLGNLLGGLSHLLDSSANVQALLNKLDMIAGQIQSLL